MRVFCLCANCACSSSGSYSLLKGRRAKQREERRSDGQTVEMALNQINVITALIRQPFNLNAARAERGRQAEGRRGGGRGRMSVHLPPPPLISPSVLSLALMSSPIVCPGLFKIKHPPEELPGDRRARSYHTPTKQLHLKPEGALTRLPPASCCSA